MKTCTKCAQTKELSEFSPALNGRFGVRGECRLCHSAYKRELYVRNREHNLVYSRLYHAEHRDVINQRHKTNRELSLDIHAGWSAGRRASIMQRTPPWATARSMKRMYRLAANKRRRGFDVHVDHIVPLQGKLVSGLHCLANLQILTAAENLSKHNHFAV